MILELLQEKGISPKKKSSSNERGAEYASPCPRCGGKDRFLSFPDQGTHGTWFCRGCNLGGDAIEFLLEFEGLSFGKACQRLKIAPAKSSFQPPKQVKKIEFQPKEFTSPSDLWQSKAGELAARAHAYLLSNNAELEKLAKRGLPLEAVKFFMLGFLPGEKSAKGKISDCYFKNRESWGLAVEKQENGKEKKLWIPRGLVLPILDNLGNVIRIRIRRPDADRERFQPAMKYVVLPGSQMSPLFLTHEKVKGYVVVESELDAMACYFDAQKAGLPLGALSVGTNLGKPDTLAHADLKQCLCILLSLDFDQPDKNGKRPGIQGLDWWKATYRQVKRWPVPVGKDPGEAFAEGVNLASWLMAGLPPVFSLKANTSPQQVISTSVTQEKNMPLGRFSSGLSALESGTKKEETKQDEKKQEAKKEESRSKKEKVFIVPEKVMSVFWGKAKGNTALSEAVLPENCVYSLEYLREYYQGKAVDNSLLIPCPKQKWFWIYYSACLKCEGHMECICAFLTSPQMIEQKD